MYRLDQTGEHSFYFNKERKLICIYEHTIVEYPNGDINNSLTVRGTLFASRMKKDDWERVYKIIVLRDKKEALLMRTCKNEAVSWACNQVISGVDFLVDDKPLTEGTRVLADREVELMVDNISEKWYNNSIEIP